MPRRPRLHIAGAFYHVMARGNRKQHIFYGDKDYEVYLRLMRKYSQRYNVEVHGYALMPNHVHMLLRMGAVPIAKFMQGLQQSYTQYFNKAHFTVGHVFQGRYKSLYVDRDEYLLELIRYIHINPVKDGLVEEPTKYRWSSHRSYFLNKPTFVKTSYIKNLLAEYGGTVIDDYRLVPESLPRPAGAPDDSATVSCRQLFFSPPGLPEILNELCMVTNIEPGVVLSSGRTQQAVLARRLFAYLACRMAGYPLKDVADYLSCSVVSVSKSLRWVEETMASDAGSHITKDIERVKLKLV